MYGKLILCILFMAGAVSSLPAQGVAVLKSQKKVMQSVGSVGKISKQIAAKLNVRVPNVQVGREALLLTPSHVGVGDYSTKVKRYKKAQALFRVSSPLRWLETKHWTETPFPGYIAAYKPALFSPGKQAQVLNEAFGADAAFKADFVSSFDDVRFQSVHPVTDGVPALEALQTAAGLAALKKSGFLTIAVKGNAFRPKDVLIWNADAGTWISLNASKAAVIRGKYENLKQQFKDENAYWAWQLENQGVVIRPNQYEDPTFIRVSTDGINWHQFGLDTRLGADLWDAWNDGLYISYDRHTHAALFSTVKEAPAFSSVELVQNWRRAHEAGVEMTESAEGLPVFVLSADVYPNLWMYNRDGSLKSEPGARLTVGEYFYMDPLVFMEELLEISRAELASDPSVKLVFLAEKARMGEFGEVRECVIRL